MEAAATMLPTLIALRMDAAMNFPAVETSPPFLIATAAHFIQFAFVKPDCSRMASLRIRRRFFPRIDPVSEYRYREAMLMCVNCWMLWSFTWLEFLIFFATTSFRGSGLWLYHTEDERLGMTVPDLFIIVASGLSIVAVCAVWFGTKEVPGRLKRTLATVLFALMCTGFPVMMNAKAGWQLEMLEANIGFLREEIELYRDEFDNPEGIPADLYFARESLREMEELRQRFLDYREIGE